MRLLIIDPLFGRQLIEIGEGGSYNDPERVLWDERSDGPMPDIDIGGAIRVDDDLHFDEEVKISDSNLKTAVLTRQENAKIIDDLMRIDSKSIRALREGNQERLSYLESQAIELRSQLVK
jgi:hypothetical protein